MAQKETSLTVQNLMCIVYHDVDLPGYYQRQLKSRLKKTFYYLRTFHDVLSFATYIKNAFIVNNVVFICSGDMAEFLCDIIEKRKKDPKNPFLYELQFRNQELRSKLTPDRRFQCIDRLFEKIDNDIQKYVTDENNCDQKAFHDTDENCLHDSSISFGIHDCMKKQDSFSYLSDEQLRFFLFQSFVEVLLGIPICEEDVKSMWSSCRQNPCNTEIHFNEIDDFELEYDSSKAIRFYTKDSFLFRRLNKAFRCEHIAEIFAFRALITHIHQQLCHLLSEQKTNYCCEPTVLHRGKQLSKAALQQLKDNQSKLISINGFLSTTKDSGVARTFADTLNTRMGYETVLFEMHLDQTKLNDTLTRKRPFADISKESYMKNENEVLFFLGFVWRIRSVESIGIDTWKIVLDSSTDVEANTESQQCSYFTIGKVLHELGEYKDAITFYTRMLESTSDLSKKPHVDIYYHMAASAYMLNMYQYASDNLEKAERLIHEEAAKSKGISDPFQLSIAEDNMISAMSLTTNKGLVYQKMNETSKARRIFIEACEKHGSTTDKAKLYYYLGALEFGCGEYDTSLDYYLKADSFAGDPKLKLEIKSKLDLTNRRIAHKNCLQKINE